jgi:predicted phosphodiesterase
MMIALISDTHLTPLAPAFDANLASARGWIGKHGIATTIHLGDVTADGQNRPEEIAHAAHRFAAWPGRLLMLAGNHDIGDNPGDHGHPVAEAGTIARFSAIAGPGRWRVEECGWTLIGIDAQLLGRGDPLEAEQAAWLDDELGRAGGRPVGLFLHKPLFRDGRADDSTHHRYAPPRAREELLGTFGNVDLRFVASGHTHQSRSLHVEGIEHRWVPSTAFVLPDAAQERIGMKEVGMTLLTLDPDRHRFETFRPEGIGHHDIADHPNVYPHHADRLREIADARPR